MKQKEYEKKIKDLGIDLERLNIVVGSKTNVPYSKGVYFEDGKWFLYGVGERQNFSIAEKGDEDSIFEWLYLITLSRAEDAKMIEPGIE